MGAVVSIIAKIMPESPDVDLKAIETEAKERMESQGAKSVTFEEKPIAFGLKAIFMKFAMPEEKGTDLVETMLSEIKSVSSVTIEDYRRAFG